MRGHLTLNLEFGTHAERMTLDGTKGLKSQPKCLLGTPYDAVGRFFLSRIEEMICWRGRRLIAGRDAA